MSIEHMYRTPKAELTPELRRVRERYDGLADDVLAVAQAPAAEIDLSLRAGRFLSAEARTLDAENWNGWLETCADDALMWVPLSTRAPHPATDQSLFLDDRRRLTERIWRFTDPNAWAVVPFGRVTRAVSGVEAWPAASVGATAPELLVSSSLDVQHVRSGHVWSTRGRQVHRLRQRSDGSLEMVHKILLLPVLSATTTHLGWLL